MNPIVSTKTKGRKPTFTGKTSVLAVGGIRNTTIALFKRLAKKNKVRQNAWIDGAIRFAAENGYNPNN